MATAVIVAFVATALVGWAKRRPSYRHKPVMEIAAVAARPGCPLHHPRGILASHVGICNVTAMMAGLFLLDSVMVQWLMPHLTLVATLGIMGESILKEGSSFLYAAPFWTAVAAQVAFLYAAAFSHKPTGRLLDLLAFTSYFFQVLFLSLPGFACNQPLQTYRFILQLVGALFMLDERRAATLALTTYAVPVAAITAFRLTTDLFLKTIWMDGFGTLVILLLLRTIRIVHSHCQDGGVASQDKLALAEARRNILSVVTDGEMLLMKNGKIVQAEPRCRHYIEGMLGQEEEVKVEGALLQDLLHPAEVRSMSSICPAMKSSPPNSTAPACSFHARLRNEKQVQMYMCPVGAERYGADSELLWLVCFCQPHSEAHQTAAETPAQDELDEVSRISSDTTPPGTLASQRQEVALPEIESLGFTLDIYSEELTMLQVKLNFNISQLQPEGSSRMPTMEKWLLPRSMVDFREWLIDQVQAELAGTPTVAYPGPFEIHLPGSSGGTLQATEVAVTKMHVTNEAEPSTRDAEHARPSAGISAGHGSQEMCASASSASQPPQPQAETVDTARGQRETNEDSELACFLVHVECKNITQRAARLPRRRSGRRSRRSSSSNSNSSGR
ncbi:unnamed protein product [Symbiodinium natans]|uniref:Uncharacterized protein n=1 Tax=Symbiodinium natans TaxID=878477 RepID=A0A812PBT3_9DINO|nr:unnamed protein product [Symbiodinium natans]